MSYILDALKRAEAERNGAAMPRVPLPTSFVAAAPIRRWPRTLLLGGAPAALATIAVVLWLVRTPAAPSATTPSTGSAPQPRAEQQAASATALQSAHTQADSEPNRAVRAPVKTAETTRPAASTPAAPSAPKPKQETQLGTLRDLPEHIRREIPPLVIEGYLYSGNRADRTVLINKRLLREGDEVAPGLMLESLLPNGMVLDYRGYRYRSTY